MENASGGVSVRFTEDAQWEKKIVQTQEYQAPFNERYVEAFDTVCEECPLVVQVLRIEEITGADEKNGDVELKNPMVYPSRSSGVGQYNEDYGYGLADRK